MRKAESLALREVYSAIVWPVTYSRFQNESLGQLRLPSSGALTCCIYCIPPRVSLLSDIQNEENAVHCTNTELTAKYFG